jgi:hypothetical protein
MAGSDEDRGSSRRLGAEGQGWSSRCRVFGGRTIERSGDTVCGLYRAQGDEEHEFLSLAPKPRSTVSPGLASKPVVTVSLSLASKPVATIHVVLASKPLTRVFRFETQNRQVRFGDLAHKITATVSWFGPQNQVGGGLSVCASKPMTG